MGPNTSGSERASVSQTARSSAVHKDPHSDEWSEKDGALMDAVDELHQQFKIGDQTWKKLAENYDNQQLIEICMVIGQYHMVAFTLNSLEIESEPGVPGFPEPRSTS